MSTAIHLGPDAAGRADARVHAYSARSTAWPAIAWGVLFLVAAASVFAGAGSVVGVVYIALVALLGVLAGLLGPRAVLVFLLTILPLQPFLTMPLAELADALTVRSFVATKEVVVLMAVSVWLLRYGRVPKSSPFVALYALVAVYTASLVMSPPSGAALVSYREGAMLLMPTLLGWYAYRISGDELVAWFAHVLLVVGALVAAFGLLERFVLPESFWDAWGAKAYLDTKFNSYYVQLKDTNVLPQNWYTYVDGDMYRRITSTIGDATSFSRFVAVCALVPLYWFGLPELRARPARVVAITVMVLAIGLSLGRGGMLIAAVGIAGYAFHRTSLAGVLLATTLALVPILAMDAFSVGSASALRHVSGLRAGIDAALATPAGHGLGSSGQLAVLYGGKLDAKISESFVGGLAYQLGAPGMMAFLAVGATAIAKLGRAFDRSVREERRRVLGSLVVFVGIIGSSFLANSAVAPISSAHGLIFVGMGLARVAGRAR